MPSKKRLTRLEERLQKEAQKLKSQLEKELAPKREPLQLQCVEEDLTPTQLQYQKRLAKELTEAQNKLDGILKSSGGDLIYKGEYVEAYSSGEITATKTPATKVSAVKSSTAKISSPATTTPVTTKGKKNAKYERERSLTPDPPSPPPTRNRRGNRVSATPKPSTPKPTSTPQPTSKTKSTPVEPPPQIPASVRPTESTAVGGLATGKPPPLVDLTTDDGRPAPDSREVSFNKLQGKTFPSLIVIARPHLRTKDLISVNDRPALDAKVKSVLMHTPTKFTEWLIQQGLVRSEQICITHANTKLKLGMYSDVSKFPYSGGYVWISECCPTRFVSVFSGSLFEAASHPPSVLLKLIYHWACQTNVQNIVQWVKVDNFYVKGLFTWLRAACTTALHHHFSLMGGKNKRIEVGVISLGTTTQDGNQRQVKVEVLGILDPEAKQIRLRAVEPLADSDSRNYKKRFSKILEPLNAWVHKDSIIMTDLTVDKSCLNSLGFEYVVQAANNSTDPNGGNSTVMEYLRRIVPRMFQNTLSLLSRQIIQQFLDELVWREWFGPTAAQAFDNIVLHLAEQTRQNAADTLIVRLNRIAANPFKNWSFFNPEGKKVVEDNMSPRVVLTQTVVNKEDTPILPTKRNRKRNAQVTAAIEAEQPKAKKKTKSKSNNNEIIDLDDDIIDTTSEKSSISVSRSKSSTPIPIEPPNPTGPLENYYYGTLEGKKEGTNDQQTKISIKCCNCKSNFTNNIELLDHLLAHAHNVPTGTNVTQCRFCLAMLPSKETLDAHIDESHPKETYLNPTGVTCVICATKFQTANQLTKHMSNNHVMAELPYECGTCLHRTSSHRSAVDHFYQTHEGTAMLQCPFCLKSISVWNGGKAYNQNVNFFMQHLQKHQKKGTAKKCNRCALWFVHKWTLKEHQQKSHSSCYGKKGLVMWEPSPNRAIIIARSANSGGKETLLGLNQQDGGQGNENLQDQEDEVFTDMVLVIPDESLKCKECDMEVGDDDHYTGVLKCSKCNYLTCCDNAMEDHGKSCKDAIFGIVTPAPLISDMFCVCGYKSNDGNFLAKHLAICERKSAYPTVEDAKKAISPHSMLDVLGLVRKPEEINKTQEDSAAPAPPIETSDLTVKEESDIVIEPTEVLAATTTDDITEILDDDVTAKLESGLSSIVNEASVIDNELQAVAASVDASDMSMDIDLDILK